VPGTAHEAPPTRNACVEPPLKSISIDYAVLERDRNISVLEAPFDWDDVGNWESVSRHHPADESGNVVIGRHCGIDSHGCIIHSTQDHLVATIGIRNCIIVHTADATLIADRSDEDAVRRLVARLEEQGDGDVL
jgi:mannose-1-phosphate guanylyltransferase